MGDKPLRPRYRVALIREVEPEGQALKDCRALVGTRRFADGYAALPKLVIRRLRRQTQREPGRSPVVIFMDDCYGVMAVEELLAVVGFPPRQGLLPTPSKPDRPPGPT